MFTTRYTTAIGAIAFLAALLLSAAPATRADGITVTDQPPVGLVLFDNLMSGRSQVGDVVHFETLAPVYDEHGTVLVPAGCLALGHVTRSKGSGMFGKAGKIEFSCEYVIMPNGDHVPLAGARVGASGANGTAATAAVTVLVSPLGLLIKGGTIKIDKGTPIQMYIASGATVAANQPAPALVRAEFTMRDKNATDVVGTITGFDGAEYVVQVGTTERKLAAPDIASISIDVAPAGGQ